VSCGKGADDDRMKLRILKNEPRELRVEVEGEGHTFCNLVQEALLEIKSVDFAGYNIPHPLVSNPIIYVRTKRRTMAVRAFERALGDLEKRLAGFKREYLSAVDLGTAKKGEAEKTVLGEATVSGILRTLRLEEGFHFFRGLGNSTGMVAISLTDFVEKMGVVDVCSVDFHFERQDS